MASHVSGTGGNGELSHEKIMRLPSAAGLREGELLRRTSGKEEIRARGGIQWCPGQQGWSFLITGPGRETEGQKGPEAQ